MGIPYLSVQAPGHSGVPWPLAFLSRRRGRRLRPHGANRHPDWIGAHTKSLVLTHDLVLVSHPSPVLVRLQSETWILSRPRKWLRAPPKTERRTWNHPRRAPVPRQMLLGRRTPGGRAPAPMPRQTDPGRHTPKGRPGTETQVCKFRLGSTSPWGLRNSACQS